MKDIVLITDVGSVDPDDILNLFYLVSALVSNINFNLRGIITSHHYADKRAQIIKYTMMNLGFSDIPICMGVGINYGMKLDPDVRKEFLTQNKLFPKSWGYPQGVFDSSIGEKEWFPAFGKAFEEEISGSEYDPNQFCTGYDFLTKLLPNYSAKNKLLVIQIGPLHDLAKIPVEMYGGMDIWAMGGGFEVESDIDRVIKGESAIINVPQAGYNWGICPDVTSNVLQKCQESGSIMTVISSAFCRKSAVQIEIDLYDRMLQVAEMDISSKFVKNIMNEWVNCNRGNKLVTQCKLLCDPLTSCLALNPDIIKSVEVNCQIGNVDKYQNYLEKQDGFPLITMEITSKPNVRLVYGYETSEVNPNTDVPGRIEQMFFSVA
jgi:inosine-uridine nucleoside N-ribohydrolase